MEILGIGAPELIFVIIIALIVLGPKDMQKAGRTVGRWLNQLIRSDGWKAFQQTSREIRNLPTNLMREANLELAETEKEIRKATDFRSPSPASSPSRNLNQPQESENSIRPPSANLPKEQGDGETNTEDDTERRPDVNTTDQDA
jgi:sec-independent protein translocase protein TatB